MEDNMAWVKELRVGDELAIDETTALCDDETTVLCNKVYKKITVTKITPTGRIKTSDGKQFYTNGSQIGNSSVYPLKKLTPKLMELIERKEILDDLQFDKFARLLSLERLKLLQEWQKELINKQT